MVCVKIVPYFKIVGLVSIFTASEMVQYFFYDGVKSCRELCVSRANYMVT